MPDRKLKLSDFIFDGPLGCQGARLTEVGQNHFKLMPGHAPQHPDWANMVNFSLRQGARGNSLRLDVAFEGATSMLFNDYSYSWSYDAENWRAVHWEKFEKDSARGDTLWFPVFREDTVYVGHQVPLSQERLDALLKGYARHPSAALVEIGRSIEGRPIYRLKLAAAGNVPAAERPAHYFSGQHPGEHNAQWRMLGMIEWLLAGDAEAAGFLNHQTAHFLVMMSPDAPSKGWYRVNARGVDLNRSYRVAGADAQEQAHEAFLAQADLERIALAAPLASVWAHHTWQGVVEPLIKPGAKTEARYGAWEILRDHLLATDTRGLLKPLKLMKPTGNHSLRSSWARGPNEQFDVSTLLCEGAGNTYCREDCLAAGRALMQGLARYCAKGCCAIPR